MEIFISSFEVCAPLLIVVALGVVLARIKLLDDSSVKALSRLILNVLLPISIFMNIYNGNLNSSSFIRYLLLLCVIYVIVVLFNTLAALLIHCESSSKSVIMQNCIRSNQVMFALPLAIAIGGEEIVTLASISACILTPLANIYCISEFEYFRKSEKKKNVLLNILKSPIIIATVLGFAFKLFNIPLFNIVESAANTVAKTVTGLSLIVTGASFHFEIDSRKLPLLSYTLLFKMILCPVIALVLAAVFGFDKMQMVPVLALFGSPIATSSYPTACSYDSDLSLASSTLVYSYIIAMITLPLFLSVLKILGLV